MANIGSFAGGLAQGVQAQQKIHLQRDELRQNQQLRDRQLKVVEADEAAKQDERDRAKKMRDDLAATFNNSYGPKPASEDGSTPATPGKKPGDDPLTDLNHYIAATSVKLQHGVESAKDLMDAAAYVKKIKSTDAGKNIMGALAGDAASLEKLAAERGFDAKTAKLTVNAKDGVFRLDTDKGPVDLKQVAEFLGADAAYEAMTGQTKTALSIDKEKAHTSNLNAQSSYHNAQAAELPAKARLLDAQTSLARAHTANVGQATRAAADDKVSKEARAEIAALLERDPGSLDGKGKNTDMAAFLQGRATDLRSGSKMNAAQSVAAARKEWGALDQQASAWVKGLASMSPKDRKAKYGVSDLGQLKAAAMRKAAGITATSDE